MAEQPTPPTRADLDRLALLLRELDRMLHPASTRPRGGFRLPPAVLPPLPRAPGTGTGTGRTDPGWMPTRAAAAPAGLPDPGVPWVEPAPATTAEGPPPSPVARRPEGRADDEPRAMPPPPPVADLPPRRAARPGAVEERTDPPAPARRVVTPEPVPAAPRAVVPDPPPAPRVPGRVPAPAEPEDRPRAPRPGAPPGTDPAPPPVPRGHQPVDPRPVPASAAPELVPELVPEPGPRPRPPDPGPAVRDDPRPPPPVSEPRHPPAPEPAEVPAARGSPAEPVDLVVAGVDDHPPAVPAEDLAEEPGPEDLADPVPGPLGDGRGPRRGLRRPAPEHQARIRTELERSYLDRTLRRSR